jgi:hypothetical protein
VLAADLLQSLVNEPYHRNLISFPLLSSYGQAYPIVQYADDTLIIMPTEAKQLFFLKCLLHSFAESTGLKVNFVRQISPANLHRRTLSLTQDRSQNRGKTEGSFSESFFLVRHTPTFSVSSFI